MLKMSVCCLVSIYLQTLKNSCIYSDFSYFESCFCQADGFQERPIIDTLVRGLLSLMLFRNDESKQMDMKKVVYKLQSSA